MIFKQDAIVLWLPYNCSAITTTPAVVPCLSQALRSEHKYRQQPVEDGYTIIITVPM